MKATVVIPTFNRATSLLDTLQSVLSQDYSPMEVIVVDDGSTDETAEVLKPLIREEKIIFIQQNHKGRPAPGRNRGMEESSGDIVFIFDSDDIMLPGKIRLTMEAFQLSKLYNIGFCCTDFFIARKGCDKQRHFLRNYYEVFQAANRERLSDQVYILSSKEAYRSLLAANFVGTSSVALPRSIIQAGFRFDETFTNSDDYDMWLKIARDHDLLVIDQPLHEYIVNSDGVLKKSTRTGEKWRTHVKVLRRELAITRDPQARSSACRKLSESYRALFQTEVGNRNWKAAALALFEALKLAPLASALWLLRRVERRVRSS